MEDDLSQMEELIRQVGCSVHEGLKNQVAEANLIKSQLEQLSTSAAQRDVRLFAQQAALQAQARIDGATSERLKQQAIDIERQRAQLEIDAARADFQARERQAQLSAVRASLEAERDKLLAARIAAALEQQKARESIEKANERAEQALRQAESERLQAADQVSAALSASLGSRRVGARPVRLTAQPEALPTDGPESPDPCNSREEVETKFDQHIQSRVPWLAKTRKMTSQKPALDLADAPDQRSPKAALWASPAFKNMISFAKPAAPTYSFN
jgi:hypothetical protein